MMRKVTENEINRIRTCNARIRNENHLLRCTLRNISADPYNECSKVLSTVIDHCTKKKSEPKSGGHDCPPCCTCCSDPCCPPKPQPLKLKTIKPCQLKRPSPPCCFSFPCSSSRTPSPRSTFTNTKTVCKKPQCCCCIAPSTFNKFSPKSNSCDPQSSIRRCPPKRCTCSPCSHSSRSHSSHSFSQQPRCSFQCPPHRSSSPKPACTYPASTSVSKSKPKCCCYYCTMSKPYSLISKNCCSNHQELEERSSNHEAVGERSSNREALGEISLSNNNTESSIHENESATTRPSAKILGELAFQLERRILDYVFGMEGSKRRRFYGYTVNNICYMMNKECKNTCGVDDPVRKSELAFRLKKLLIGLRKVGYDIKIHGDFAQHMVNTYGLLPCPPDMCTIEEFGLHDASCIGSLINELSCTEHENHNLHVLLSSLKYLSKCDGRPLFVW